MPVIVSVIMPVYNAQNYLTEAVESVLRQTFKSFELIIVNDGSIDASEAIINGFKDSRIIYLKQENQGQANASNKGIKIARGRYIKFFDADDVLNPLHLEKQYSALNGHVCYLASCQWAYFYDNKNKVNFQKEYTHKDYNNPINWFYDTHAYDKGMIGVPLWLIPIKILDKAGHWDERLSLNNDFDFSTRLLVASKGVKFAKGARLFYRKGVENSLTLKTNKRAFQSALLTTELAMKTILSAENSERLRKLFADRFQSWIYQIYPREKIIISKMKTHVRNLGGSQLKPQGGNLFRLLTTILPWTWVKQLQYIMHKTVWNPVLKYKQRTKFNNYTK